MSIHDLLDKMESAEDDFLQTEFLAPVLPGGRVRVRIAGVVCTLRVVDRRQPGWAILKTPVHGPGAGGGRAQPAAGPRVPGPLPGGAPLAGGLLRAGLAGPPGPPG